MWEHHLPCSSISSSAPTHNSGYPRSFARNSSQDKYPAYTSESHWSNLISSLWKMQCQQNWLRLCLYNRCKFRCWRKVFTRSLSRQRFRNFWSRRHRRSGMCRLGWECFVNFMSWCFRKLPFRAADRRSIGKIHTRRCPDWQTGTSRSIHQQTTWHIWPIPNGPSSCNLKSET